MVVFPARVAYRRTENEHVHNPERAVEPERLYDKRKPFVYFKAQLKGVYQRVQPEKHNERHKLPARAQRAEQDCKNTRAGIGEQVADVKLFREGQQQGNRSHKIAACKQIGIERAQI